MVLRCPPNGSPYCWWDPPVVWCYGIPGPPYCWWHPPVVLVLQSSWETLLLVGVPQFAALWIPLGRAPWLRYTLLLVGSLHGVTVSLGHLIAGGIPQWCYGIPGSPYCWWCPPVVLTSPWVTDTLLLVVGSSETQWCYGIPGTPYCW